MTKTEQKLALVERQRRFAWALARDEHTRAAAKLVAGKTHDLLNMVQIVKLASEELGRRCEPAGQEFVADLQRAAASAEASLQELMAVARPAHTRVHGARIGAVVTRVVGELRTTIPIDLHLAVGPDTATELGEDEVAHLILGVALAAADTGRIEIYARDRTIDDVLWVEIVRGANTPVPEGETPFDLKVVEMLAARGHGELTWSERRGGGSELIVALPATSASA